MEKYKNLLEYLSEIAGNNNIHINEPMKKHTSIKTGGCADILITPTDRIGFLKIIRTIRENNINYLIMGNGTNLIVRDGGIRGVVVKTSYINNLDVCDKNIRCETGLLLSKVANTALKKSLSGMEFASGIPGTIGGAIVMNAGAYGSEMNDIVIETECVNQEGELLVIKGSEHQFGYRTSIFQKEGYIVLSTLLKLNPSEKENITKVMSDLNTRRREKQPIDMPSAGSVFKRPVGYYAGKLIDDCGLRGYSIGGAAVSGKHCGFIVNNGNATSQDIIELIKYVQETVKIKFGVKLETEVKIIGEG